jgi:hypothetical protein
MTKGKVSLISTARWQTSRPGTAEIQYEAEAMQLAMLFSSIRACGYRIKFRGVDHPSHAQPPMSDTAMPPRMHALHIEIRGRRIGYSRGKSYTFVFFVGARAAVDGDETRKRFDGCGS